MGARQSVQTASNGQQTAHHQQQQRQHHARTVSTAAASSSNGTSSFGHRRPTSQRTYSLPSAAGAATSTSSSSSMQPQQTQGQGDADSDTSDELDMQRVLQLPALRLNIPRFRVGAGILQTAGSSQRRSLPVFPFFDIKCPVCNKVIPSDEAEMHLVMCLTRPRITYNDDVLAEDKGECVICFDEMLQGDTIGRLPCLCIYHKACIDSWFKKKNCCPEHPGDD